MAHSVFEGNIGRNAVSDHIVTELTEAFLLETDRYASMPRIYEVIRCIGGVPLFAEDHIERLSESFRAKFGSDDLEQNRIMSDIRALILSEGIIDGNVKVVVTEEASFVFPSAFYYPPETTYARGVFVGITEWERSRPNVKMIVDQYKKTIADKLSSVGPMGSYFETLLKTEDGRITEGSRSNVFFVMDGELYTSPDDMILKGITRRYVLEAVETAGYKVRFECVRNTDIGRSVFAGFLSGTSIGVLPVAAVEDVEMDSASNEMILAIRNEYNKLVSKYLDQHNI